MRKKTVPEQNVFRGARVAPGDFGVSRKSREILDFLWCLIVRSGAASKSTFVLF